MTEWNSDTITAAIDRYMAMTPPDLLVEIERLARRAQAGEADWNDTDELVMALRVLQHRDDTQPRTGINLKARHGSYLRSIEGPRLEYIHDPKYGMDESGRMISLAWRVERQGFAYASTAAGRLREVFTHGQHNSPDQWLKYRALRTLPYPLPADDDAPVIVYMLTYHVAQLLNKISEREDISAHVGLLLDRQVKGVLYPSEDPYSWRD
jgi:hypothetical protein